ncbi:signal peptidase I [Candidatus Saccharibacteria bacterium]|nr:signal peptidase I [Candidatus Saccharibacteria bacterium]MBI3338390.1 signal peptidase I [Candidatus Saccharibacteria bacterium]
MQQFPTILDLRKIARSQAKSARVGSGLTEGEVALATSREEKPFVFDSEVSPQAQTRRVADRIQAGDGGVLGSSSISQDPISNPESEPELPEITTSEREGWGGFFSIIAIFASAFLIALFFIMFVFQSYEVDGPSMETTLQNKDRLVVVKVARTWARLTGHSYIPNRGDIIIFIMRGLPELNSNKDRQLIKRVIGLPGDRVVVNNNKITVYNGSHPEGYNPDTNAPWNTGDINTSGNIDIVVPANQLFVCGDNRENSLDSRYFGTISANDVVGKLSLRILPINKAGTF